jgi:Tol biopolymer transport system component
MNAENFRPLAPGTLVGRYRVLASVGSGAMGEVYRAEDTSLGRIVALKTLPGDLVGTPDRRARFENEGRVMASLSHANLVQVFDVGEHEGVPYLVQEFVEGETLEDVLLSGPVAAPKAARWIAQAAEGLISAHEAGILHRDIKPSNLMVGRDGRIRVLDFGLAKVQSPPEDRRRSQPSLTTEGLVVGTAQYMSPEQASGKKVDARSDIFSLGIVFYELLAGKAPFEGETAVDVMYAILHLGHPPIPGFGSGVVRGFAVVVDRALAKDPAPRFPSMREMAAAVEEVLADGGWEPGGEVPPRAPSARFPTLVPAPSASSAPSTAPAPLRRRRLALLAAGACVLAAFAGAAFLWRGGGRNPGVGTEGLPLRPIQLTSSACLDVFPAFSPDGRTLVYSSDRSGRFEIYRRSLAAGGREIQLTTDGLQNLTPAWSPDGETIAYHVKSVGGVWLLPALGGVPRQLTTFGSRPSFSPDGKSVVFESGAIVDFAANSLGALPPSVLWVAPLDGSPPRPLTRVGQPSGGHGAASWSPDGKRIAFASYNRTTAEIWSIDVDGTNPVKVSEGNGQCYDPVWGADGGSVLFPCWSESWSVGVYRRKLSTASGKALGAPEEVATFGVAGLGWVKQLAVSRDGTKLAYAGLTMVSNIWKVPLDARGEAAGPESTVTRETGRNSRPAVSGDGKRIAISRWRPGANQDIWIVDADGGNAVQRTTDSADDDYPYWFRGDKRLGFMSVRRGHRAYFSLDLVTGREEVVADFGAGHDAMRISPDGTKVAFHSNKGGTTLNVWVADLPAGTPRQITSDRELAGFPCWSPDGTTLAFEAKRDEDVHVFTVPAAGGVPLQLTRGSGQSWPYSFSPDGTKIAFAGLREGVWNVGWVSRDGKTERAVTVNRRLNNYVRYPAWSPTGDALYYELAETTGNIWLVEMAPSKGGRGKAGGKP